MKAWSEKDGKGSDEKQVEKVTGTKEEKVAEERNEGKKREKQGMRQGGGKNEVQKKRNRK